MPHHQKLAALSVACLSLAAQASHAADTMPIEPGEWLVRTQETHEGSPKVLQALASLKALRSTGQLGKPGQGPAASPNSVEEERECLSAEEIREANPQQALQQLIASGMDGWQCQFSGHTRSAQGEQLQYSCRSPLGQSSKGQALMRYAPKTYHWELSGTMEHKAGDPSSRVRSQWIIDGRWLSAKCSAASRQQDAP